MKKNLSFLAILAVVSIGGIAVVACSDDSSTPGASSSGTLNPDSGSSGSSGSSSGTSGSSGTTDGGCPNTPAGCFCGTPTTQAQFLNRCTTATALPVNLTFTPATSAQEP